jgi:hypothetical protein
MVEKAERECIIVAVAEWESCYMISYIYYKILLYWNEGKAYTENLSTA